MTCSLLHCEMLNENLDKFWKLENYDSIGVNPFSISEKKCEQYFKQTATRNSDGGFVVKLPFREEKLPVGNNKEIALKRFYCLERTFKGNKVFREQYVKFMQKYIDLGHMSLVPEFVGNVINVVYLPHHGVTKGSSSSTKLRVVFDASAKNHKGVLFNDALQVGPVLQDNLIDIIIRFRFHKIVIISDLQKMYHQVMIHHDDRDFQHVLWRFSIDESIMEY